MASLESIGGPSLLLRASLSEVSDLRSLGWLERRFLPRAFKGEEIHLGPPMVWLEREWEVRLGSVYGTIFKLGLEVTAYDRDDAVSLSTAVYSQLHRCLGTPKQHDETTFVWDGDDGNAVLQLANVQGERRVMVFLTSSIVQTFVER